MAQLEYVAPKPPPPSTQAPSVKPPPPKRPPSLAITERVITEDEIFKLVDNNPKDTRYTFEEILARLNKKDRRYIAQDIKQKRPLKVPIDFDAYRSWSPLPKTLPGGVDPPRLIVIVKDIPFTGWYDKGRLKGDSLTCVGKQWGWTESGIYKVLDKAEDKYSNLYNNVYGEPAWMPMALRIYGAVWLHAGDVVGPYCSHGCINLPPDSAKKLYDWATIGTPVIITDTLSSLNRDLSRLYFPPPKEPVGFGPSTN
jgi:lipoprotein-anchoring transpeptidase ErfK/SrfK